MVTPTSEQTCSVRAMDCHRHMATRASVKHSSLTPLPNADTGMDKSSIAVRGQKAQTRWEGTTDCTHNLSFVGELTLPRLSRTTILLLLSHDSIVYVALAFGIEKSSRWIHSGPCSMLWLW